MENKNNRKKEETNNMEDVKKVLNKVDEILSPSMKKELGEKQRFVKNISATLEDGKCGSLIRAELKVFINTESDQYYEYLVVTYRGGAIAVRNCKANSISADLREIAKLANGGYYDEVEWFRELVSKKEVVEVDCCEAGVDNDPNRAKAARILGNLELHGEVYYKLEDWLTNFLSGKEEEMPKEVQGEYLKSAIRLELKDFFYSKDDEGEFDDEDVEECLNRIINDEHVDVLDVAFISDTVDKYIEEKEERGDEDEG